MGVNTLLGVFTMSVVRFGTGIPYPIEGELPVGIRFVCEVNNGSSESELPSRPEAFLQEIISG